MYTNNVRDKVAIAAQIAQGVARSSNLKRMALATLLTTGAAGGTMYGANTLYKKFVPESQGPWFTTPGGTMALGAGLGAGMGAGAGMLYGPAVGAGLGGITGGVAGYYGNKLINSAAERSASRKLMNPYYTIGGGALGGIAGSALGALGKGSLARMIAMGGLGSLLAGGAAGIAGGDTLASSNIYNPYLDKTAGYIQDNPYKSGIATNALFFGPHTINILREAGPKVALAAMAGNAAGTAAATWLGSKAAGGGRVFLPTLIGGIGGPGGMVGAYGAATDQLGLGNRIKSMFN